MCVRMFWPLFHDLMGVRDRNVGVREEVNPQHQKVKKIAWASCPHTHTQQQKNFKSTHTHTIRVASLGGGGEWM